MTRPVLDISGLSIRFSGRADPVLALRDVSLVVPQGDIVGIVGESGSGKSTLALAVMRLLASGASVAAGSIRFEGNDILSLPEADMRRLRGTGMAMVFQDPMTALNPVMPIGTQMMDVLFRDPALSRADKRARVVAALKRVGLPDAEQQLGRYPFQFSGGMRQRIAIAMALLQRPRLLIADEITTALDVTLEAQILDLLRGLRDEIGCSILFISHNLGAIAAICDRTVVLYAGEVVEAGPTADLLGAARHPYTRALLACDPSRIEIPSRSLPVIPGEVPDLSAPPQGCIFAARCPAALPRCVIQHPADWQVGRDHSVRCHLIEGAAE